MLSTERKITLLESHLTREFNDAIYNHPEVIRYVNCYGFALGDPRVGWAMPGGLLNSDYLYGLPEDLCAPRSIEAQLYKDGLLPLSEIEAYSDNFENVIAMCVDPDGCDFHFLRLEEDVWIHKPGRLEVGEADWNGRIFIDYDDASLLSDYTQFAGFWTIPEEGISYVERFDLDNLKPHVSTNPSQTPTIEHEPILV